MKITRAQIAGLCSMALTGFCWINATTLPSIFDLLPSTSGRFLAVTACATISILAALYAGI
jgi:hypothetical protein